jgi:mannose-6-phosphate isomerase-like protein (cupin superfamily)
MNSKRWVERPWGYFSVYAENEPCTVKMLCIQPYQALSLQMHNHREQRYIIIDPMRLEWSDSPVPENLTVDKILHWYSEHEHNQMCYPGDEFLFGIRVIHRASNHSNNLVRFFEVSFGLNDEEDIIRLDDRYGRAIRGIV